MQDSGEKNGIDKVIIFTDGSARGNPGNGGYGAVLRFAAPDGKVHQKELSKGYRYTTNNRMEIMAAIAALEALKKPCSVVLYSDSQYLVNAFEKHWIDGWLKKNWMRSPKEQVKNADLWKRLLKAVQKHDVRFEWVRGHNGHAENELCDMLATAAADGDDLIEDTGFKEN
ncbi:MAG: ribonuclease HI [Clostridia bacterium]|nr:ribonuclease HI [Clostridia bacterium]